MNDAQDLLTTIVRASEGVLKTGYENAGVGVNFSISSDGDTVTFNGTIPIGSSVDASGNFKISAKDFFTYQQTLP
jgi:hypothetical protein